MCVCLSDYEANVQDSAQQMQGNCKNYFCFTLRVISWAEWFCFTLPPQRNFFFHQGVELILFSTRGLTWFCFPLGLFFRHVLHYGVFRHVLHYGGMGCPCPFGSLSGPCMAWVPWNLARQRRAFLGP